MGNLNKEQKIGKIMELLGKDESFDGIPVDWWVRPLYRSWVAIYIKTESKERADAYMKNHFNEENFYERHIINNENTKIK